MSILNMKLIEDENFLKEYNLLIISTLGSDYGLGTKNCTDYWILLAAKFLQPDIQFFLIMPSNQLLW
jgi:hypothetical protein